MSVRNTSIQFICAKQTVYSVIVHKIVLRCCYYGSPGLGLAWLSPAWPLPVIGFISLGN